MDREQVLRELTRLRMEVLRDDTPCFEALWCFWSMGALLCQIGGYATGPVFRTYRIESWKFRALSLRESVICG